MQDIMCAGPSGAAPLPRLPGHVAGFAAHEINDLGAFVAAHLAACGAADAEALRAYLRQLDGERDEDFPIDPARLAPAVLAALATPGSAADRAAIAARLAVFAGVTRSTPADVASLADWRSELAAAAAGLVVERGAARDAADTFLADRITDLWS